MTNGKKAFTIVELLVVMAIIGILLTLAVVGIQALQKGQREVSRLNDLRNLQAQLESYYARFKTYPSLVTTGTPTANSLVVNNGSSGAGAYTIYGLTSTSVFTPTVTLGVPGATFGAGTDYATQTCSNITADAWNVYYRGGGAQSYALFACTENGKTENLGSKTN